MKQFLLLCAIMAMAVSCKGGESTNKELDPNAKISIKPKTTKATKAEHFSPVEIVRQTTDIVMVSPEFPTEPWMNLGISDSQKDLITPKIMMWGKWVIYKGKLSLAFIESKDFIFVTRETGNSPIKDTVAYIPNADLRVAEAAIKAAYAKENFDLVYKLFDEAYQFTPITGAEWLELKSQGKN